MRWSADVVKASYLNNVLHLQRLPELAGRWNGLHLQHTINHTLNCFSNHFFLCASLSHCPCDKNMINPCIGWVIRCLELIRSTGSSRHIQMKIWEGCCFYKVLIIHPSLIWMLRSSDSDAWQVSNNKRVLWKEGPRISGSEEDRRPRPRTDTMSYGACEN